VSFDAPERGEKVRGFEREGEGWTASESTKFGGVCTVSGDKIEQPGGVFCRGKREGKGEETLGFIAEGLDGQLRR
jgi:hypothetical protein